VEVAKHVKSALASFHEQGSIELLRLTFLSLAYFEINGFNIDSASLDQRANSLQRASTDPKTSGSREMGFSVAADGMIGGCSTQQHVDRLQAVLGLCRWAGGQFTHTFDDAGYLGTGRTAMATLGLAASQRIAVRRVCLVAHSASPQMSIRADSISNAPKGFDTWDAAFRSGCLLGTGVRPLGCSCSPAAIKEKTLPQSHAALAARERESCDQR